MSGTALYCSAVPLGSNQLGAESDGVGIRGRQSAFLFTPVRSSLIERVRRAKQTTFIGDPSSSRKLRNVGIGKTAVQSMSRWLDSCMFGRVGILVPVGFPTCG